MQETSDTAFFDNFFYVSVLHPLHFSWLNNARWRHSCICAAFVSGNVLICGLVRFTFPLSWTPLFSLLDNRRWKALLFAVAAKPSETKAEARPREVQAKEGWHALVLRPCKLSAKPVACFWQWQHRAARTENSSSTARERTLLFVLFSVLTE